MSETSCWEVAKDEYPVLLLLQGSVQARNPFVRRDWWVPQHHLVGHPLKHGSEYQASIS